MGRVVLLTDFGTADGYAATVAGVVASGAPDALIEHAAHDIDPGDILGAAIALRRYALHYPPGTVHLAVVDPGVGTERRPLAATVAGRHVVVPDNGLLTLVFQHTAPSAVVAIQRVGAGPDAAPTFHGRDIFAPAAAFLARGEPLDGLGETVADPVRLDLPGPERTGDAIRGQVLHVDRFGTLLTNVPAGWLRGAAAGRDPTVTVEGISVGPVHRTYGDVEPGALLALVGSLDLLEISVRDGRADRRLGQGPGATVVVA